MRSHACGELRPATQAAGGDALRVGGAPSRPRRRDLHRPARPRGRRAGGLPPRGRGRGACRRAGLRGRGRGAGRPAPCALGPTACRTPTSPPARSRSVASALEVLNAVRDARRSRSRTASRPARTCGCEYRYLDLRRPEMTKVLAMRAHIVRLMREHMDDAGVRRGRDADPHPRHARGLARLPRAEPAVAGHVLRAAAVAAAAEAAADGGRPGPLLPDRAVPPRRGRPRRPRVRVHPARRRDVVRRRGGPHRADRTALRADRARDRGGRGADAVPASHVRAR